MYEKSRVATISGAVICWIGYCISLFTHQWIAADIFSPICAFLVMITIGLVALSNQKYRTAIIFIAMGPMFWTMGDLIYLFGDFGLIAPDSIVSISDPIYRMTTYAYVIGLLIFSYVQFTKKDIFRLVANALLFSVATFIISVAIFERLSQKHISFFSLKPAYFQGILVAMFIIVFFMVIIANRSSRKLSFYGLMVMIGFFLYGYLDIAYMMIDATGGQEQSVVVDALFLLSIVIVGMAYSTTSIYHLIEKTEKAETKRSSAPGIVMAVVILIVGLLLMALGNLSTGRFSILLITTLAYFLLSKSIEVNELNEALIQQKEMELSEVTEKLENVSVLDIQTGLKNRRAWGRYCEDFFTINRGKRLLLYSIDVNFFKMINHTYGNQGGDAVLMEIGRRLLGIEGPGIFAYRMDGHQFLVVCEDEMHDVDAARFADYISDILDRPFEINGKIVRITFRISGAIYPDDTQEFDKIMNCLETVRSTNTPNAGATTCCFFDSKIMPRIQREQKIEGKLQDLDYDEAFELYYQPQVVASTKELIGMEALLRWKDEELGFISPSEFIPIAEKMGVMPAMGEWIVREAFLQIHDWNTNYKKDLVMGVNISPVQLQEEYFTDTFFDIMEAMEVPSKWIDIEITESIALSGILNSTDVIKRMKQKGITISVDDFGTGYETFANMIYFEFNRIKIAKELVDNIAIHPNAGVIVGAIISMAKGMNLDIIAEGVEEETQLEVLTKLGCDQMQGFYFGKPVPADEFEKTWLK